MEWILHVRPEPPSRRSYSTMGVGIARLIGRRCCSHFWSHSRLAGRACCPPIHRWSIIFPRLLDAYCGARLALTSNDTSELQTKR